VEARVGGHSSRRAHRPYDPASRYAAAENPGPSDCSAGLCALAWRWGARWRLSRSSVGGLGAADQRVASPKAEGLRLLQQRQLCRWAIANATPMADTKGASSANVTAGLILNTAGIRSQAALSVRLYPRLFLRIGAEGQASVVLVSRPIICSTTPCANERCAEPAASSVVIIRAAVIGLRQARTWRCISSAATSQVTRRLRSALRKHRSHRGTQLRGPAARLRRGEAGW
jgi:hypothetical protein